MSSGTWKILGNAENTWKILRNAAAWQQRKRDVDDRYYAVQLASMTPSSSFFTMAMYSLMASSLDFASTAFHASHFALSFRLVIAGRSVLIGPTVACLKSPYSISFFSSDAAVPAHVAISVCSSNSSFSPMSLIPPNPKSNNASPLRAMTPTTGGGGGVNTATAAGLRRWVMGFCIIRFDLEQGQTVEECYPSDSFTSDEQLLIAFSSFPDSMHHHSGHHHRSSIHDSLFTFRFPKDSINSTNPSFAYGYVFNRQRHDDRLPRGGDQRSVVILTHFPCSSVFRPLLQILGPLCFDLGHRKALDLVARHVASWPPPGPPGSTMDLPIASASLKARLPPPDSLFADARLFHSFRGLLLQLWLLWELMIVGEPVLVIAPTPTLCSEAVTALVSIVSPLTVSIDFRPYFTIHDPDFARLNSLQHGQKFPPMVIGVTNLFFLKSLCIIPHVVSVGTPPTNANVAAAMNSGGKVTSLPALQPAAAGKKFSPANFLNAVKMRREGPLSLMAQHKEAVWSSYSPTTKPDTAVLNRLVDAGAAQRIEESMAVVNNDILRRHFVELTTNFLAPFGPYLRPTTPLEGSSPFVEPPPLRSFRVDEFLGGLATRGPGKFLAKRMRSNWLDLYRRFLEGHNFVPWFQCKRAAAEQEQGRLYRHARLNCDIQKLISKMSEVEIVDSFNSIEWHLLAEIQQSGGGNGDAMAACQKLKGDLQAVFNVLPKDMQQLLLFNPKKAALIQCKINLRQQSIKPPGHPVLSEGQRTPRTP